MKKILIVLTGVLLLNIFFDFLLVNRQKKQMIQLENLYAANAKLSHNVEALKTGMIDSWHAEGRLLYIDSIFTEEGEKLSSEYLKALEPVLIFRFSKVDCSECVVKQIGLIKQLIRNGQIRYMMICDYSNKRNLGLFKRTNAITDQVFDCSKIFENENRTPFFCICNKGFVSDVFFPDDDFPTLTESYFSEMCNKYFRE
jgi:hypothetical protein